MFDIKGAFSVSFDTIKQIVADKIPHKHYEATVSRAKVMNSWFKAEDDTSSLFPGGYGSKSDIIKKSSIESADEYAEKLRRMRLFPLESKFFASQQRIYDENNVQRIYPDATKPFWMQKEGHFDDVGDDIDTYFKDKVLFVKEELGFGASMVDLMMADNGKTIDDGNGGVIPYTYTITPRELYNFQIKQGILTFLVTRQSKMNLLGEEYIEWRAFTPDNIWLWREQDSDINLIKEIPNPFGRVPATLLKGITDQDSAFRIGKPRRYSLRGLYLAASELFYDLQKGSLLFGHPIPLLYESMAKAMAGVEDSSKDKSEYDPSLIKEKTGYAVVIPDDTEPPKQFFYQADTAGLDHLRQIIFGDLLTLIFFLASIREKNKVVHNASGRAKQFDNLDEQGLLAQTAIEMEAIERDQFGLMADVRGENINDFTVKYSKHHDLSTADEIFQNMTDAAQYGIKTLSLWEYWTKEYLRKRSAPADMQDKAENEITNVGLPIEQWQVDAMSRVVGEMETVVKMRPELLNNSQTEFLNNLAEVKKELNSMQNQQ